MSDGLSPRGGCHHFLHATSLSMALSSIASASNFFSAWRSRLPVPSAVWPPIPPGHHIHESRPFNNRWRSNSPSDEPQTQIAKAPLGRAGSLGDAREGDRGVR